MTPTHTYSNVSSYYVCATFNDSISPATWCDSIQTTSPPCALSASMTVNPASCDSCADGSANITVSGATGTVSYQWSDSAMAGSFHNGLLPGVISCIVSDASCSVTVSGTVSVNNQNPCTISATLSTTPASCSTCADGSATVSVTGAAGSVLGYSWSDGFNNGPTHTGLLPGSVSCTVTDPTGCQATATDSVGLQTPAGGCSASFTVTPDSALAHTYYIVPTLTGVAPYTCVWTWGDGSTSTGVYPVHTYAGPGSYTICLDVVDADTCSSNFCGTFALQRSTSSAPISVAVVPDLTGIAAISTSGKIEVYPNPIINVFTISLNGMQVPAGGLDFYLFDQQGKKVSSWNQTAQQMNIDRKGIANGIYFVKTVVNGKEWSRKVVMN